MTKAKVDKSRSRRTVSNHHDPAERQADRAAEMVAHGGSVTGWSFSSVPSEAGVHREEKGNKNDEMLKKTLEAAAETKVGKELQEKVKEQVKKDPLVKGATEFLDTTPGKVVAGGVLAAGVGGLAAAKQPLPFQPPAFPLDKIKPGLSAQVTYEGPVNAPTFVGISLTFKEQGGGSGKKSSSGDAIAKDKAAIQASLDMFKDKRKQPLDDGDAAEALARAGVHGPRVVFPLKAGDKPKVVDQLTTDKPEDKKPEDKPVQRDPASATETMSEVGPDMSSVNSAVRGGGRELDPSVRRSMEARFGYDFTKVRIHDDAQASSAAEDVQANAFTVGDDIVFANGRFNPSTAEGRHLLAHELAHVVQQDGRTGEPGRLHRRSIFESIGILLGLEEGTFSDEELHAYVDSVTSHQKIQDSYDSDNKARAVVRRWKSASPGFDLLGPQKVLLVEEMLTGPTLGDDEECILDLLERSDAGDVRAIFNGVKYAAIRDNVNGDNSTRLEAFVNRRIKGGVKALEAGEAPVVMGDPVPANAPAFAFDEATFEACFNADRSAAELIALIDRFSGSDRDLALKHLPKIRLKQVEPVKKVVAKDADNLVRTTDEVILHYRSMEVPHDAKTLQNVTSGGKTVARRQGTTPVAADTTLTGLPEADRKKIQVVTTTAIEVIGLKAKFDGKTTYNLPANTSFAPDRSVDAKLHAGLSNVAAALVGTIDWTTAPLPENATTTLLLDLRPYGGINGLYRFSHSSPSAVGKAAPQKRVVVEQLGAATAPPNSAQPAEPKAGQTAAKDPVEDKLGAAKISHSGFKDGKQIEALRAAIQVVPSTHLAALTGLKFKRVTDDPNSTEAGKYDPSSHTVMVYNKAFGDALNKFEDKGVAVSYAARLILHEIGHALDLRPLGLADDKRNAAEQAVVDLEKKYPNPKGSGYTYTKGSTAEKDVKATEKAAKDTAAEQLKVRSRSGSKTELDQGSYKDVIGTEMAKGGYREAARNDGVAVSKYGETDWQESYAEAYTLYLTSPDTLEALRPATFAYLSKNLP